MPFTPFHLGPGAAFKAIGGRNFSFMVFGGSQVLMDIEPLIGMIRGSRVLHGYTHTILGALIIGLAAAVIGRPISAFVLRVFRVPHYPLTWLASLSGALAGTFSHITLDAVMHSDMSPWWPIASGNGLLLTITIGQLHLLCMAFGLVGGLAVAIRVFLHGRA